MKEVNVVVSLTKKLKDEHPVAMLVQIASRYDSRIYLAEGSRKVNAKSIMGMMALGIDNGVELAVSAEGTDEDAAAEALAKYLKGETA